jgi:hypothetical protein
MIAVSGGAQIDRFGSARVGLNVKRNFLPLIESPHARRFYSSRVDKHVLAATIRRYKAVPLCRIEKLDRSDCHECSCSIA